MKNKLSFRFKGNRDYIQGGDIFDVVEEYLEGDDQKIVEISFKTMTKHHLFFSYSLDEAESRRVIATGKLINCKNKAEVTNFFLLESDDPVISRYDFDENAIMSKAKSEGDEIVLDEEAGFSTIERVIALTKKLNYQLSPNVNGKWLFGQLKLNTPLLKAAKRIKIVRRAVVENRFSSNTIFVDDINVGEIRFIVGPT